MRREGNKIIFERKNCTRCHEGTKPSRVPCRECSGTGKGKRGKVGGCKKCYGSGSEWNQEIRETCPHCKGDYKNAEPETYTDYMPKTIWESLEFRVIRGTGPNVLESLIGIGTVYTSTDYGRAWDSTDENIIAGVRSSSSHQACKVCDEQGNLCQYIAINVGKNGYTVKSVF